MTLYYEYTVSVYSLYVTIEFRLYHILELISKTLALRLHLKPTLLTSSEYYSYVFDSRCTFLFRGLAQDCPLLGVSLNSRGFESAHLLLVSIRVSIVYGLFQAPPPNPPLPAIAIIDIGSQLLRLLAIVAQRAASVPLSYPDSGNINTLLSDIQINLNFIKHLKI